MIVFYAIFIGCNGRYGQMAISRLLLERCLKKESNVISKIKDKTAPKGARLHEFFVKSACFFRAVGVDVHTPPVTCRKNINRAEDIEPPASVHEQERTGLKANWGID